jgi:hypothetical protein
VGRWLGMGGGGGGVAAPSSETSAGGDITTESVVRGSIVMSGFVVVPLLLLDDGTVVEDRRGLSSDRGAGEIRPLGTLPPTFQALLKQRRASRVSAQLDPKEYLTLPTIDGSLSSTTSYQVVGSKVVYIALVQPMGRIPPLLVNLVIGKQTSGLKYLQKFIAKHPLSVLPRSKDAGGGRKPASKL